MSGDIKALQKKFNNLISQKVYAHRSQAICSAMAIEHSDNLNKAEEKFRLPEMDNRTTQTLNVWQDREDANKLLLQEKEA